MFILCSRKVGKWLDCQKGELWWNKGQVQFVHAYFSFCVDVEVYTFRTDICSRTVTVSMEVYLQGL